MFARLFSKLIHVLLGGMILVVTVLSTPGTVSATAPTLDIVSVRADESVTIRTHDFPANVKFLVRMDVSGNRAENGIPVAELNSGNGGSFEATIMIPSQLKGTRAIAIRLESTSGYFAYNAFTNNTSSTSQPGTVPVTGVKPSLTFGETKANESVVVEARNLPANTRFTVRVGPYYSFFRDYVTAPAVTSDANGYVRFTVALPSVVRNVEMVTVRIDGGGRYAFNAFKNVTGGATIPVTSGESTCQLISVTPTGTVSPRADLDVAWTIRNNSSRNWELGSVDYKYVSGTKFHKYGDRYDLQQTVKPGETVRIVVDVVAPATAGSYTANWALIEGNATICNLSYTLRVR